MVLDGTFHKTYGKKGNVETFNKYKKTKVNKNSIYVGKLVYDRYYRMYKQKIVYFFLTFLYQKLFK